MLLQHACSRAHNSPLLGHLSCGTAVLLQSVQALDGGGGCELLCGTAVLLVRLR